MLSFKNPDHMAESSNSASFIRLVQLLIEKCLLFHMSVDECMEALSKHANIKPVITRTVWLELEKENREFFEAYRQKLSRSTSDDSSDTGLSNVSGNGIIEVGEQLGLVIENEERKVVVEVEHQSDSNEGKRDPEYRRSARVNKGKRTTERFADISFSNKGNRS